MSQIFDFRPIKYRLSYEEMFGTDEGRLADDWKQAGNDLWSAIEKFEKENTR